MSDDGGARPDPTPSDEQFTVPIPSALAPQSNPSLPPPPQQTPTTSPPPASAPAPLPPPAWDRQQTQVLPVAEPTRQLPPPPWAGGPPPVVGTSPVAGAGTAPGPTADAPPDPLLAQIGVALFWITVGWWVAVIVRLLGSLVREGLISTLFIESLGRWPEEAVVAAVISVLAALVLLFGRGSRGRDLLGWASAVLAVITVGVAIWRLLP